MLGVSLRGLDRWIERGLLTPHTPAGQKHFYFKQSDIQALRALREDKSTDIWTIKVIALQALSAARMAELRLLQVYDHLGLNATPLARDEPGIQYLYAYTLEPLTREKTLNISWVKFWAGSFFMMDEIYFELVTWFTDDDEPWRRFMDFANDTMRTSMQLELSDDLRAAYKYFDAGRRHLSHVGYMACRRMHGRRVADQVFREGKTAVDELMAVLH